MKNWKFSLLLVSFLTGCGYHWQPEYPNGMRPVVTVPFVTGDEDGLLTAEIIRVLSASGLADVRAYGGEYLLKVSILNHSTENIGYRIDPQKVKGKVRKNLLASEGRKTVSVEAALYRGDELAYGPYSITSDGEYDYVDGDSVQDLTFTNPEGKLITVLPFSLGQLEPVEAAQEAVNRPLYRQIGQKIVDAISCEWK